MLFKDQNFYPIIKTDKFKKTVQFYIDLFDFHHTHEDEGFVILQREGAHKQYLGILDYETPLSGREVFPTNANITQGSILNFYVENVKLAYQQFHWLGADLISDIDTAKCGQKFMALRDPNGNIVMVTEMKNQINTKHTKYQDNDPDNHSETSYKVN